MYTNVSLVIIINYKKCDSIKDVRVLCHLSVTSAIEQRDTDLVELWKNKGSRITRQTDLVDLLECRYIKLPRQTDLMELWESESSRMTH